MVTEWSEFNQIIENDRNENRKGHTLSRGVWVETYKHRQEFYTEKDSQRDCYLVFDADNYSCVSL